MKEKREKRRKRDKKRRDGLLKIFMYFMLVLKFMYKFYFIFFEG